jgi:RimJ/RimL family protein N-acetyltransferase
MSGVANLNTLQLLELHIQTLFRLDANGRMRSVNEIGDPSAPLFYMGRTLEGNSWRFRHDLPAAMVDELEQLCQAEPVATDLAVPPQNYAAIRAVIDKYMPHQQRREYRGPAYWIPEVRQMANNAVLIAASNSELLRTTFPWMIPLLSHPDVGPVAAAVEQGKAVSLCFCSRRPAQATEAGVETLPEFRGKGHATAAVAAWAAEVSRRGCITLYGTSWDNLASQAIARKLGMVMYGEDWSIQS